MRSAEEIEAERIAEEKRLRKLAQKRESARRAAKRKKAEATPYDSVDNIPTKIKQQRGLHSTSVNIAI